MIDGRIRIETVLETKSFDKQIDALEEKSRKLELKISEEKKLNIDTTQAEANLEKIRNQIANLSNKDLKQSLGQIKNISFNPDTISSISKAKVQFQGIADSAIKLKGDLPYIAENLKDLAIEEEKIISNVDKISPKIDGAKGFEGMMKSARKFALSLISIRGIYALLSKASQAYMQTDETTTKQMEANWVGLGTILAPAIDLIIGLFKKAVTSILYLMSVLTGANYIEKANTAILKKQTEATKELTKANDKLNASFDEMNVLQDNSSNVSSGTSIDTSALFDINDIGENARETIEKIAIALQPVYEIVKDIIKWCLDNPDVILYSLGGLALMNTIGKINGVLGTSSSAGSGLLGIYSSLKLIAAIGTVGIVLKVNSEIQNAQNKLYEFIDGMDKTIDDYDGYIIKMKLKFEEEPTEENYNVLSNLLESKKRTIQREIDTLKDSLTWYLWVFDPAGYYDIKDKIKELEKQLQGVNQEIKTTNRDSKIAISDAKVGVDGIKTKLGDTFDKKWSLNIDEIDAKQKIKETSDELGYTFNKNYPINVDNEDAKIKTKEVQDDLNIVYDEEYEIKTKNETALEDVKTVDSFLNTTFGEKYKINTDKLDAIKNINEIDGQLDSKITKTRKFKVEADTSKADNSFKTLFNSFGTKISGFLGSLGLNISIPKLATGGIVNNPGNGVFMGSYIAGERGREGIIPLTDTRAMQQLGEEIGKWISINATVPIYVGNRQIAREIKKINAESDFARNV